VVTQRLAVMGKVSASSLTAGTRKHIPREGKGARRGWTLLEVLIVVVHAMARLTCDVDMAEQAELWRLEGGGACETLRLASSPSAPGGTHSSEAAVQEMEMASNAMRAASAAPADAHGTAARVLVPCAGVVPPVQVMAPLSASPQRNSTVDAARRRVRGPSVTERRAQEQQKEQEAAEARLQRRREAGFPRRSRATDSVSVEGDSTSSEANDGVAGAEAAAAAGNGQRRGRVRANGRVAAAGGDAHSEFAKQRKV
jgi:hypothetical protein